MMINTEKDTNYSEEISDVIQRHVATFINSEPFKH